MTDLAHPILLGFDTSGGYCTAAVTQAGNVLAHHHEVMTKGQAERLMGLIDQTVQDAGLAIRDLNGIGVGIGPGNFTGIRISVSAARGLALGLQIPAVGVSAFDALRFGTTGPCACAVDARRDQAYVQVFDANGKPDAPAQTTLTERPSHAGPLIGFGGTHPAHPTAVAIALAAATRLHTETARPAPLYIRPADAAPARDAPPKILS